MKLLYTLEYVYISVDSGDFETKVLNIYDTLEKAQEEMEKLIPEIKKDFEPYDCEEEQYLLGYTIWEKGEYMSHHCGLIISSHFVK